MLGASRNSLAAARERLARLAAPGAGVDLDALFRFARIVERENSLRGALGSGWVGVDRKRELLAGLLEGKVGPVTLRVVTAAAGDSVRRRTVGEALDNFSRLAAELRDRMNA